MEYIIGVILVIIVIIIVALLYRKKLYDSVDEYEVWKVDIMNRNIPVELARFKDEKNHGDIKILIDELKIKWEFILNNSMADVEEMLYDVEKLLDNFRFNSAKKVMQEIDRILLETEKELAGMMEEIETYSSMDERIKKEENTVRSKLNQIRKYLSQNRYQFDLAEIRFEVELDEIEEQLNQYVEESQKGNYKHAKDIIDVAKASLGNLQEEIDEFPELYQKCKIELPDQLVNITNGLNEMKEEGYRIEHLNYFEEINKYQSQLLECVTQLEKKGTEGIEKIIVEIEEHVTDMLDRLENEALAKSFVESKLPAYETTLQSFQQSFEETTLDIEETKKLYFIEESEIELFMNIDKKTSNMVDSLNLILEKSKEKKYDYVTIRKEIEALFNQLDELKDENETLKERIGNIRKDEINAKEEINQMITRVFQTYRLIKNSNLPGVPNYIWTLMEEAKEKNEAVIDILEEKPLDINQVHKSLEEAKVSVNHAIENTETMIEQAELTEQVIQYANRYRSSYPVLAANLVESERLFHSGEYELSLEKAANAVEEVEPGALRRIEKLQAISV